MTQTEGPGSARDAADDGIEVVLAALERAQGIELKTELRRALHNLRSGQTDAAAQGLSEVLAALEPGGDFWIHRKWHEDITAQAGAIAMFDLSEDAYVAVLRSELIDALERAERCRSPFPHVMIDRVFSDATYIALLLSTPHITQLRPLASPEYLQNGRYQRYQTALTPKSFETAHQRVGKAWRSMRRAMRDKRVAARLCEALEVELPRKWKVHTRLQLDRAGARIRPHTDGENGGRLTFQMYFPLNKSNYETGTAFFKRGPAGFETVAQMPYRSNFAYGFQISDQSWHGAEEPLAELSEGRLSLVMRLRADE